MSPQVIALDRYLCSKYPGLEWCGVLFYSEKGGISDPDNYKVHVNYLYPMDVGTPGSTSIDNYEEVLDAIEKHPELDDMKQGFIHSHNSMDTFFSGTDVQQLIDGADQYDYFLSVITNNNAEYIARISFELNADVKIGINKSDYKIKSKVGYFECEVETLEPEIDEFLVARVKEIDANRTVGTYNSYKGNYFTLNNNTSQGAFKQLPFKYNDDMYIVPAEFISEDLLEMYSPNLVYTDKAEIEDIKPLLEDAYDISFKTELNSKQMESATRAIHELLSTMLTFYGLNPSNKDYERKDIIEYYSGIIRNNKTWNDPYTSEEVTMVINLSRVYDDYTDLVAMHAFTETFLIIEKIAEKHTWEASYMKEMLYCSVLAHISTRSKNYKIHDVEMMQGMDPILLTSEITNHYAEWLPFIRAGITYPTSYYNTYY